MLILSASVTFTTLPGVDRLERIASFVAAGLAGATLLSAVVVLLKYETRVKQPYPYWPLDEAELMAYSVSTILFGR